MGFRALIFFTAFIFLSSEQVAQDYFSYGNSNFSGLNQVIANPAAAADNRLKLDVILAGIDLNFNNSWFAIKREALRYKDGKLPETWRNSTPNVPENVFKNFLLVKSGSTHSLIFESRVLLPSVLFQIDAKNTVAFTWSLRQIFNMNGVEQPFATLFEKELDLSVTQNNRVQNKQFSIMQMSWAEYGFTYARVLKNKNQHFIKAGITPKILQGLESGYISIKNMDFLLSSKDTLSYFNAEISYAHSANFKSPFKEDHPANSYYHRVAKIRPGLDVGIVYEWRPEYQKYKYRPDGKHYTWRKDLNKYKVKLGASLVDIGKIKFAKQGTHYDLDVSAQNTDFTKFTTVADYAMFDSLLRVDYSSQSKKTGDFSVMLPTALNTQIDVRVHKFVYLNLSSHITNFNKQNVYRVHNYSSVCFAPRIEHYWFDVSVPFTYNALSAQRHKYITTGFNLRMGPLCIGTTNILPVFKGDISNYNFYAILKVAIPYKSLSDQDHDGLKDEKDLCPDEAGEISLQGCPDKDHDKIPDKDDACPNQSGLAAFRGCPDTDGDGITDGEDKCPTQKGSLFLKGCPDADKDSIPDKDDACPDVAGPKQFKGCPDTDKDGIIDKEDLCPTVKGPTKYKGCPDADNDQVHDGLDECPAVAGPPENKGCPWPDTDKDGIIDKLDSCISIPGTKEYKGCPAPVKLAPAEKRILQKAFASLEFESGKDIIKTSSLPSLNALAKLLASHKADWMLKLSGHTDNEGTETSNLTLSENRVKAVQNYLVKKGAPKENMLSEWFGQSKPVADNSTKEGRKKNRRVEMTVLSIN